jgi:hypothetical protein
VGSRTPEAMMGVVRILQEGAYQFDILDSESDFTTYKLLVLPDVIPVDNALQHKVQNYISKGGFILASYKSGLTPDGKTFALAEMGVTLVGEAPYSPDFLVTKGALAQNLPETELVMYMKGMEVKASSTAEVLMQTNVPYFNREWNHFSSHKHTPSSGKTAYPGIIKNGRSIYFMHPVFSQYNKNAPRWCKQLVLNAVHMLLPGPIVRHNGPSTMIVTLNEQSSKNRQVLHLLNYVPERRGVDFDVIENIFPLYDITFSITAPKNINNVMLVPQNKPLKFSKQNNRIEFALPELKGHQMIAFS